MANASDLPTIVGASGAGDPSGDIFQRLLKERIVFIGSAIDQVTANLVCAQLVLLEAEDPEKDISLYINSPGGSVTDGLAIYDTMQYVRPDVSTICVGLAASMGQFLLCAGSPGKRFALPHSRILMHQPSGSMQGQAADIAIQAEQIIYLKRMMAERIAFHTGQTVERIETDSDRDRWFTAEEAQRVRLHRPGDRPVRGCGRRRDSLGVAVDVPASSSAQTGDSRWPRKRKGWRTSHPWPWRPGVGAASRTIVTRVVTPTISVRQRLREIWLSRELLIYLVRTEIKVKYKNSALGIVWSMVSPAMTLAIYFVVFQLVLGNHTPNFVIFLFAGLLLWNLFSARRADRDRGGGQQRRHREEGLVPPRDPRPGGRRVGLRLLLLPVHRHGDLHGRPARGAGLRPISRCCCSPCWPVSSWPCALAVLLSAINVYLRDTQHLIEVLLTAWFWACPIVYLYQQQIGNRLGPEGKSWIYFLNPMVPLVLSFQRCIYAHPIAHNVVNGCPDDLLRPARQGDGLVRRARSRRCWSWASSCSSSRWPCSAGSRATLPRSCR